MAFRKSELLMDWNLKYRNLFMHEHLNSLNASQLHDLSKQEQLTLFPGISETHFTNPSCLCDPVSQNRLMLLGECFPYHGSLSFENPQSIVQQESVFEKPTEVGCCEFFNRTDTVLNQAAADDVPDVPLNKKQRSVARERATMNDRRRRIRIAEALEELQKVLPISKENDRAALLDDIIDHIKLLQFQLKELSRSKLAGETPDPLVFLEGYGHYLPREHMLNEPLEEVLGKLFEVNPSAANILLESRGLLVMPISLAKGLQDM